MIFGPHRDPAGLDKCSRASGVIRLVLIVLCAVANEVSPAQAATVSVAYTYDLAGRVTTALYSNGVCVVYSYDANGNRTAQTNTSAAGPLSSVWGAGTWGCFNWTLKTAASMGPAIADVSTKSTATLGGRR